MNRGEIRYGDAGPRYGRRPVLIVTATELIASLSGITCAPVTTSVRGLATRVPLGTEEGLREASEAVCDGLVTIPKAAIDTVPIGSIPESRFIELDRAIARALDIRRANLRPA